MAITKTTENDKIEIVGAFKAVQVRCATIIKEDDIEITRKFNRKVLYSGFISGDSNTWNDTDLSGEDADVRAICTAAWSQSVKDAYKANLIANKPS